MKEENIDTNIKNIFTSRSIFYVVTLISLLACYVIWDQSYWWANRPDYSFGYLVPLFSLYVLYDRKATIFAFINGDDTQSQKTIPNINYSREKLSIEDYFAFFVFLSGCSLFLIGGILRAATRPQNPATLAISLGFSMIFLSIIFIFSKSIFDIEGNPIDFRKRASFTLIFLFPALVWLISAPLVSVIETKLKVFLLTQVTIIVFTLMDTLGFVIEREGNVLHLPEGKVGVEEACSGIRSLTACLFAGSFLAAVYLKSLRKKFLLIFMAMIFAIFTNLLRSGFLTFYAYYNGADSINDHWTIPILGDIGSVHDVMGIAVLVLTTIGLLILIPILNFDFKAFSNRLINEESEED